MKLTDEQLRYVGESIYANGIRQFDASAVVNSLQLGRAAVAAVAPLLLAEPEYPETEQYGAVLYRDYRVMASTSRLIAERVMRLCLSNRLASLTAKPDPAVDAVWQELRSQEGYPPRNGDESTRLRLKAEKLVSAVDAARAK